MLIYTPLVSEVGSRDKRKKLHYATEGAVRTLCGQDVESMSSRCMDDMTLEEARAQADSCRRCISAMV
jgi:hypothetical protein